MDDYTEWVTMNPWTKEISNPIKADLCADERIKTDVKEIYYDNQDECNRFLYHQSLPPFNPDDRRFYVYAWHTDTIPKKYFYVGKGTKLRYKHILKDIESFETGVHKNNPRFKNYAFLKNKFGIDYEIMIDKVSDYEALIYEQALKIKMSLSGEVLLNVEGIPSELLPEGWQNRHTDNPIIENSAFYRRYYEFSDIPYFDDVDIRCLQKNYFYLSGTGRDKEVSVETSIIKEWTKNHSGKTYSSGLSKGVLSIVVFRFLPEERYRLFKSTGKMIFSSVDVISAINSSSIPKSTTGKYKY